MPSPSLIQYGSTEPLPEVRLLKAGPLSMQFEEGNLRYIRYGTVELLRMIYHAVRDHNWATIPNKIHIESFRAGEEDFEIRYSCECKQGEVDFSWEVQISGTADGTISFEVDGRARSSFLRNRIGICVLHPILECAGKPCQTIHPDGSTEAGAFPEWISPHQPFKNLAGLSWQPAEGLEALLSFEGEIFETEDQRNWTDDSYKTYGTPLERPFPVRVQPGDRVWQRVRLRIDSQLPKPEDTTQSYEVIVEPGHSALPSLGVGASSEYEEIDAQSLERLRALHLATYRLELDFSKNWRPVLEKARHTAQVLALPLELALFFTQESYAVELEALIVALPSEETGLLAIFQKGAKTSPPALLAQVLPVLRRHFPQARIGGGSPFYFTELNRNRPENREVDFLTYSVNPQVHQPDQATIIENMRPLGDTVRSAKAFGLDKAVHLSPITLKPRRNPDATGAAFQGAPGDLPSCVDPRQVSLFAAGWLLGSVNTLAQAGAAHLVFFETIGRQGLMQGPQSPEGPFPAAAGEVFAAYWALWVLGQFQGGEVRHSRSSHPLQFSTLWLEKGDRKALLIANHQSQPLDIALPSVFEGSALLRLGVDNAEQWRQGRRPEEEVLEGGSLRLPGYELGMVVKTA